MTPLPSPCISQCKLDAEQNCIGCRRSLDEIRLWSKASEAEKKQIWQRLLALPMLEKRKQCQNCSMEFSCGSGGEQGCWCMDFPPDLSVTTATGDCYCPSCLTTVMTERELAQSK
jgi:predicted Fe-S protein YdhL (DUF1289 family)